MDAGWLTSPLPEHVVKLGPLPICQLARGLLESGFYVIGLAHGDVDIEPDNDQSNGRTARERNKLHKITISETPPDNHILDYSKTTKEIECE